MESERFLKVALDIYWNVTMQGSARNSFTSALWLIWSAYSSGAGIASDASRQLFMTRNGSQCSQIRASYCLIDVSQITSS